MDEQLAFYSIVLNWSFADTEDEANKEEIKTNHNNYDNNRKNHNHNHNNHNNNVHTNHNSILTDDMAATQPPLKKRKLNNNNCTNSTPPPLEPATSLSNSPKSPLVMKIPKISADKNGKKNANRKEIEKTDANHNANNFNANNTNPNKNKKKTRFKRAVTLKSKPNTTQPKSDFNELFPVSKFQTITKFHRNQTKASSLSEICTFPNVLAYKEHFGALLFDDLRARLDNKLKEELKRARDMLPAEIIQDIGHNEYVCCSFQILSNSSDHWMYKVNTKMVVLIIYNNGQHHKNKNNKFKKVPPTHVLGIIDEPPSATHLKVQIHLNETDERYEPFMNCFERTNNKNNKSEKKTQYLRDKVKTMQIIFLDNIQNRMREFRAICSADRLRLKEIIIDPKSMLLQQKYCAQKNEYMPNTNTEQNTQPHLQSQSQSWVWSHVPDAYRKRLGRYLNSSQCKAIEKACVDKGITLLQGPPGTGKTRTVLHLMNAFHIAKTQAMFQSWLKRMYLRLHNKQTDNNVLHVKKPRILVAAPSNAAVDEIIIRLMTQQFVDGNDCKYAPPIIRIGNMEKCRIEVGKQVSLHSRVEAFLAHRYNTNYDQETNRSKLSDRIRFFQSQKIENESKLNQFIQSHLIEFSNMDFESFQMNETGKIIHLLQEIHKSNKELQRCIWVQKLPKKPARDKLIISILLESEIIFTTLNSAGGRELRLLYAEHIEMNNNNNSNNNKHQLFDHCIIDEAGQCTEPDILIPLGYDIDSVILVGDPQQLPATVFATGPSAWLYERSLFERLMVCGYPVHLLDTQYRMHPEIAHFPNIHFYNDKLKNGNNVLGPKYIFHFHSHVSQCYKPFLFFNISSSNEKRGFGQSLYNKNEVGFIIQHLKSFFNDNQGGNFNEIHQLSIGVITPYKQQQLKIIDALNKENNLNRKNIEVATVDFYQGREKDIVFFSCVRAHHRNGIGFLADIRRMNVAITRAKYSLWIVGNILSLQKNNDWNELIKHAKKRKCMRLVTYNKQMKRYQLIDESKPKPKQNVVIPRPTLMRDNNVRNNNNNNVQSMPMIIDYGININQSHNNNLNNNNNHHNNHVYHHAFHRQSQPQPQPQYIHRTQTQRQQQIHANNLMLLQQQQRLQQQHLQHVQHVHHLHMQQQRQQQQMQHIQNGALIDYTKSHTNSSAFDD